MKTKKIIFAVILATGVLGLQSFIQTTYYQTTTTYNLGNGVYYKCDIKYGGHVTLYNASNIYTYADWTMANGDPVPLEIAEGEFPSFTMTDDSDRDIKARVNSALTAAEKQIVNDNKLAIAIIVNPQTGKVMEVFFGFPQGNVYKYNRLPPSTFRKIEEKFIAPAPDITGFAVTDVGRTLNYVMFSWSHTFK